VLIVTMIFLAPIYWIASTAFKPRNLATTVPPTVVFTPESLALRETVHQALAAARQ
jgi:ABC-type glycerol-3-phosphate transport system permease component